MPRETAQLTLRAEAAQWVFGGSSLLHLALANGAKGAHALCLLLDAGASPETLGRWELGAHAGAGAAAELCAALASSGTSAADLELCARLLRTPMGAAALTEQLERTQAECAALRARVDALELRLDDAVLGDRAEAPETLIALAEERVRALLPRWASVAAPLPDLSEPLGEGAGGVVYGVRARDWAGAPPGTRLVLKRVRLTSLSFVEVFLQLVLGRKEAIPVVLPILGLYLTEPLAEPAAASAPAGVLTIVLPRAGVLQEALLRMSPASYNLDDALAIAEQVAFAVGRIHARGVAHRDIKPPNIFNVHGRWVLGDFGVAAAAAPRHTVTGTPGYQPPETMYKLAHAYDPRAADIFALGVVLLELYPQRRFESAAVVCGCTNPREPSDATLVVEILTDLSGLEPWYAAIVRACLAPEPARRPSADQVLRLLERRGEQSP